MPPRQDAGSLQVAIFRVCIDGSEIAETKDDADGRLGFGLLFLVGLEHRWVGDRRVKSNHHLPTTFQFLPKI